MPFKSKKQSAACFASRGFGGKVDCEKWAHKTNYKSLPKRKKKEKMSEGLSFKDWLRMDEAGTGTNAVAHFSRIVGSGGDDAKKKKDKMVRREWMPFALEEAACTCGPECKCPKDCKCGCKKCAKMQKAC